MGENLTPKRNDPGGLHARPGAEVPPFPRPSYSNEGANVPQRPLTLPPAAAPASPRRRWWRTMASDCPGVKRVRRRWQARVSVGGRWLYLGSFATEFDARRAARRARELKQQGRLPRKMAA